MTTHHENKSTVFIVDDEPPMLDSLQALVESLGLQAECYQSAASFLEQFRPPRAGCLLADVRMPEKDGLELQEELTRQGVFLPVIFLSGHGEVATAVQAMRHGAVDFLEKPCRPEEVARAIREALALTDQRWPQHEQGRDFLARVERLSEEERTVLAGLVRGRTSVEISEVLSLSLRTVQFRRKKLREQMGASSRAELVHRALAAGWCPEFPPPGWVKPEDRAARDAGGEAAAP